MMMIYLVDELITSLVVLIVIYFSLRGLDLDVDYDPRELWNQIKTL